MASDSILPRLSSLCERHLMIAAPDGLARRIEQHVDVLAPDGGEGVWAPPPDAGERLGEVALGEPPDVARFEGMAVELAADGPAVEHQAVQRHGGEAEAEAVEHGDDAHWLALDARLLE